VPEPLELIADAVKTGKELSGIKAELAQLHAVVLANLAEQQRLNGRMDQTVSQLAEGLRDTRERLVCVEAAVAQIPELHKSVDELNTKLARYVGGALVLVFALQRLIDWAIKQFGA
jgi:hypothetical protein